MALIGLMLFGCEKPSESEAEAALRRKRNELKADYEVKLQMHSNAVHQMELDQRDYATKYGAAGIEALDRRLKELKLEGQEVERAYVRALRAGVVFDEK